MRRSTGRYIEAAALEDRHRARQGAMPLYKRHLPSHDLALRTQYAPRYPASPGHRRLAFPD